MRCRPSSGTCANASFYGALDAQIRRGGASWVSSYLLEWHIGVSTRWLDLPGALPGGTLWKMSALPDLREFRLSQHGQSLVDDSAVPASGRRSEEHRRLTPRLGAQCAATLLGDLPWHRRPFSHGRYRDISRERVG